MNSVFLKTISLLNQGSPHAVILKIPNAPGQKMPRPDKIVVRRTKNIAPGKKKLKNTSRRTQTTVRCAVSLTFLYIIIVCKDWYPDLGYFVTALRVHFSLCRRASWLPFDNSVVFRLGSKSVNRAVKLLYRAAILLVETAPSLELTSVIRAW